MCHKSKFGLFLIRTYLIECFSLISKSEILSVEIVRKRLCRSVFLPYMAKQTSTASRGVTIKRAHPGFQERFIRSNVDVTFGGGVLSPQPLTSSVLTPTGFVKLSDLKAGDEVVGLANSVQTITHYDLEGEKDCIRITLEDGSSAESALDHKWWVLKEGTEMTAISFELLESFQIASENRRDYDVSIFRYLDGKPVPVRIKSVEDIGKKEVVCIGVSNDDELYITDDYLITKNCGKAQPLNARVLTPFGYRYLGDLEEGDVISCTRGGTQTVQRIYDKGLREVWKVKFEHGSVECCMEHLWTVFDVRDGEYHTLSLQEIYDRGCNHFFVPCPAPIYFDQSDSEPLALEPYTLGRIIAAGTMSLSENMLAKLKLAGIEGKLFIPERYKLGSIAERKDLLRGILDGTVSDFDPLETKIVVATLRSHLIEDVADIVHSLGGTIKTVWEGPETTKIHVIMPRIDKFFSPNATSLFGMEEKCVFRQIKSVTFSRKALTRCILVSDPTHLYITNDFIPTHNTYAAILMVAEPSLDPRFRACFTRRNLANLKAGGGILDDFKDAYGEDYIKVTSSENPKITFPSGAFVDCIHIADEEPSKLMERAKGWQYDCIYLDELTSYQFSTFRIVGTRCRGKASWTGKIRGTTNPKRSHWTRKVLDWYIGPDGFVMPERDGVVRYYYQLGDTVEDMVDGSTPEEVYEICKPDIDRKLKKLGGKWTYRDMIRSFTFYAGKMAENTSLISNNKSYVASVAAVGGARAQQLTEGNFNVDEDEIGDIPIPSSKAQSIFTNDECRNGDYWITVDLADVGTDNLVALFWDGFHIDDIMVLTNTTPRQNFERIRMFATRHNVPDSHVIYDATHGTYMYDYMPNAVPFISAGSPIGLYALMSDRLKDECYLRLIDAINNNRISISETVARHPYKHAGIKEELTVQSELLEECSVVRLRETPRGKKKLFTKKEMNALLGKNRSMDVLDPCAMRMYPCLQYQYGEELDLTNASRVQKEAESTSTFNVWDETNWY